MTQPADYPSWMVTCAHCDRPARARGYCWGHYKRWQRHGDPTLVLRPWGRDDLEAAS